jgi:hypothetical protein
MVMYPGLKVRVMCKEKWMMRNYEQNCILSLFFGRYMRETKF